jgi:hypothetical protein
MKIEWLNTDLTEAIVTRGWWRPKWTRVVRTCGSPVPSYNWWFTATERRVSDVDYHLARAVEVAREAEMKRREREANRIADDRDWLDTGRFPRARLIERKP